MLDALTTNGLVELPIQCAGRQAAIIWGRTHNLHASPAAVLQLADNFLHGSISGRSALLGRKHHLRASATSTPSDSEGETDTVPLGPATASAQEV